MYRVCVCVCKDFRKWNTSRICCPSGSERFTVTRKSLKNFMPIASRITWKPHKKFSVRLTPCFRSQSYTSGTIVIEIAVPTWKLVLKEKCKFVDEWCEFVEQEYKKGLFNRLQITQLMHPTTCSHFKRYLGHFTGFYKPSDRL